MVNLASLNGQDGFSIVDRQYFGLGGVVGSAGDINGDGFDDVVMGDAYHTIVVFGKAGGFAPSRKISQLTQADAFYIGNGYGASTQPAGDINGDGFDDLLVGSLHFYGSGAAYVVYGKTAGFGGGIFLGGLDGSDGFRIEGAFDGEYAGAAVSGAGDINGDGFADVIVGAPGSSPAHPEGKAYVVFGKGDGFPAVFNVSTLDGTNGFRFTGDRIGDYNGDQTGHSVSGLGDFNGDGFDDVLIGSVGGAYRLRQSGAVVFGKASGFPPDLAVSDLDGTNGFQLFGDDSTRRFNSLSGGGDLNGDGLADLILTVNHTAYVVFGGTENGLITNHHTAQFFDADGDLVTVKVSRGSLTLDNFNVVADGTLGDGHFAGLDLTQGDFAGASVTITARRGPSGGDGLVDLGFLNAAGIDLGKVTIDGDLGRIDAGDNDPATPALLSLRVHSIGLIGETPGDPAAHESHLTGGVGQLNDGTAVGGLRVRDSIRDSALHIGGDLARLIVGGDFADSTLTVRGDYFTPDRLTAQTIAAIRIGGDVDHSQLLIGYNNGGVAVNSEVQIGTVTVGGDWIASDLAVGGKTGLDNAFGTSDDGPIGDVNIFGASIALDDLNGDNGVRFNGDGNDDGAGFTVSGAGDLNGDGYADMIVAAPFADLGGYDSAGSIYVVFGKGDGFGATLDLGSLDGTDGFRLDGATSRDFAGLSVSGAGDVNGDGFDDLIVATAGAGNNGLRRPGSAYVVFGQPAAFPAVVKLRSLDGTGGFRMDGLIDGAAFGGSVSAAGDVNADGFDDMVIGARGAAPNGLAGAGSAYVILGRASFAPTLDVYTLDGTTGFRLDGARILGYAGSSVSGAGDVNGDGFADVLIGAPGGGIDSIAPGAAYVVFGKADGFAPTLDLSQLDGSNGFRLDGEGNTSRAGQSVSGAGDINGDGFADIIIGSGYSGFVSAAHNSNAFVIFGKAGGFAPVSPLVLPVVGSGFVIQGKFPDLIALSVSAAGDVNGDGFDDVIVGSRATADSFVIFGKASSFPPMLDVALLNGDDGFQITGEYASSPAGNPARAAGDVNGDGFDDVIIGHSFSLANSAYLVFGSADPVPGADHGLTVAFPDIITDKLIHSRIASVIIAGRAIGTAGGGDHFGIVAEEIALVQVGGSIVPLRPGAGNDTQDRSNDGSFDGFKLGSTGDVTAREIYG